MMLKNATSDANDVFLCTSILAVVSGLKAALRCVNYCSYERKHNVMNGLWTSLSEPL